MRKKKRGAIGCRNLLIGMVGLLLCAALSSMAQPAPVIIRVQERVIVTVVTTGTPAPAFVAATATGTPARIGDALVDACFDEWRRDMVSLHVVGDTLVVTHRLINTYEMRALLLRGAGCAHTGLGIEWVELVGDDATYRVEHIVARALHLNLLSENEAIGALVRVK